MICSLSGLTLRINSRRNLCPIPLIGLILVATLTQMITILLLFPGRQRCLCLLINDEGAVEHINSL